MNFVDEVVFTVRVPAGEDPWAGTDTVIVAPDTDVTVPANRAVARRGGRLWLLLARGFGALERVPLWQEPFAAALVVMAVAVRGEPVVAPGCPTT